MDEARAPGLAGRTDQELMRLARDASDDGAFRELYRRHRGPVLGFLTRLLGDPQAAEDVLQETFLRVHQHLERYDARQPFRPWLFRIARNLGLNALRGKKKPSPGAAAAAAGSDRVPREAAREESRAAARAALHSLPPELRALLLQRHGLGMKLEELAQSWEVDERTIRTRLQGAVDRLTQALLLGRAGGAA